MAGRQWTQAQIDRWLQEGSKPGQADVSVSVVELPGGKPGEKSTARQIVYTRNDGQTITVLDTGKTETTGAGAGGPDPGTPGGENYGPRTQPVYEELQVGKEPTPEARDSRSPEARRNDETLDAQRQKNQRDPSYGRWETDAERASRERQEAADARQQKIDEERNAQQAAANALAARNADRADRGEERQTAAQEAANAIAQGNQSLAQAKEAREAAKDARPQILGTPTDTQENVGILDPTTGELRAAPNPLFDRAKAESARKREELNLQIQLGRLQADEAAAQYNRWFKQNIEVPFMQAAEARAQAAEKRAALQAEEQRRQFAAQEARQRRAMGLQAGQAAVSAELQTLPYRVGPAFSGQFSSAINSLAQGGSMANNASAGIHFTQDAFEFDAPDLKGIAKSATKDALKGLTDYDPAEGDFATAGYEGIAFPTAGTMGQAPAQPTMNYQQMMDSIKYQPNSG